MPALRLAYVPGRGALKNSRRSGCPSQSKSPWADPRTPPSANEVRGVAVGEGGAVAAALGDGETAGPSLGPFELPEPTLVVAVGAGAAAVHDAKKSATATSTGRRIPIECACSVSASSELLKPELLLLPLAHFAEVGSACYRSAIGTQRLPVGPVYSDSGLISRLSPCCSMMCAHQPAIRPTAKIDVPRSAGIPRNVYVVAA